MSALLLLVAARHATDSYPVAANLPAPSVVAAPLSFSVSAITSAGFFGAAAPPAAAATEVGDGSLVLKGTIVTGDAVGSSAIIAMAGGRESWIRVGQTVTGNLRLASVDARFVLLDTPAGQKRLSMPQGLLSSLLGNGTAAWQRAAAALRPQKVRNSGIAVVGSALAGQIGIAIVRAPDGQVLGLKGATAARWGIKGLRADDLVTAIDGVPVDDFARNKFAFAQLSTMRPRRVMASRDGQAVALTGTQARRGSPSSRR